MGPGAARLSLAVALGGALGALARHGVGLALLAALGPGFPWGTLAVNVGGSFLIGAYAALSRPGGRFASGPARRLFVMTGFCGGFTTFSIFSLETLDLLAGGAPERAALNVGLSAALWLAAVAAGWGAGVRLDRDRLG